MFAQRGVFRGGEMLRVVQRQPAAAKRAQRGCGPGCAACLLACQPATTTPASYYAVAAARRRAALLQRAVNFMTQFSRIAKM